VQLDELVVLDDDSEEDVGEEHEHDDDVRPCGSKCTK
jgi:hypothetical protein